MNNNKEKLSPILLYNTDLIPQFILLDQKLIGKIHAEDI